MVVQGPHLQGSATRGTGHQIPAVAGWRLLSGGGQGSTLSQRVQFWDLLLLCTSLFTTSLSSSPWGCQLVNSFLEKASEKVLDSTSSDFTR